MTSIDSEHLRIQVSETDFCVNCSLVDGNFPAGAADMDYMEDDTGKFWWLARVVVKKKYRGCGYGRKMIEELKARTNGLPIVVCPGGYDITREEQDAFYMKCGFARQDKHTLIHISG